MKVKLFSILSLGVFACMAVEANATLFYGQAVGSWGNVNSSLDTDRSDIANNDDGLATGDSATFQWGEPIRDDGTDTGTSRNQFSFNGAGSEGTLGQGSKGSLPYMNTDSSDIFSFGSFDYYNGSTYYSRGINGVDLEVYFSIEDSGGTLVDTFSLTNYFSIINTPNVDGKTNVENGDIVQLHDGALSHLFSYDSKTYQFEIVGFSSNGGADLRFDFSSPEAGSQNAELYARISEVPVPEPATMVLFGTGLLGLLGLGKKRKLKA